MSGNILMKVIVFLCLVYASNTMASDKIYTWVDKNGVSHFSHTLPSEDTSYKVKEIKVRKKRSFEPAELPLKGKAGELDNIAKENCAIAQQNIKILNSFANIKQDNADGSSQSLSSAQKKAELELANKQVQLFCKDNNTKG